METGGPGVMGYLEIPRVLRGGRGDCLGSGGWSCRSGGGEVLGWWGPRGGVSRCHSIDLLPKFWLLHSSNCTQIVELTMHGQVKYNICTCQFAVQHEKQSPNLICGTALTLITIKKLCLSEVRDPSQTSIPYLYRSPLLSAM